VCSARNEIFAIVTLSTLRFEKDLNEEMPLPQPASTYSCTRIFFLREIDVNIAFFFAGEILVPGFKISRYLPS
jgi:hypothetical protein